MRPTAGRTHSTPNRQDRSASPKKSADTPRLYRIAQLKDYLPLGDDVLLSGRNTSLSGIGQSRSTSNLAALKKRQHSARKSRGSFGEELDHKASEESEDEVPELQGRVLSMAHWGGGDRENFSRRMSVPASMLTPQMRSERLIGYPNPRYRWEQYWKTDEQLKKMRKAIRKYYERTNYLIQHYMYIDRLLDSSLPGFKDVACVGDEIWYACKLGRNDFIEIVQVVESCR